MSSEFWGFRETVYALNIIAIGYPTGEEKPKDKWNPSIIHWENGKAISCLLRNKYSK